MLKEDYDQRSETEIALKSSKIPSLVYAKGR
jgi:hypothetical protein